MYVVIAIFGVLLLAFVGAQADADSALKRLEPRRLRLARKVSFTVSELFLLATVLVQIRGWPFDPLFIAIGNIATGMMILGVNAASLNSRQPPQDQNGLHISLLPAPVVNLWTPLRAFISIFRRH